MRRCHWNKGLKETRRGPHRDLSRQNSESRALSRGVIGKQKDWKDAGEAGRRQVVRSNRGVIEEKLYGTLQAIMRTFAFSHVRWEGIC